MVIWLVVIASAIWVYVDAKNIGVRKDLVSGFWNLGAGSWCAATLLLWIVAFPCYLIKRTSLKEAAAAEAGDNPSIESPVAQPVAPVTSVASEAEAIGSLEKLADLRDRGILSGAEFDQKKQQILAS